MADVRTSFPVLEDSGTQAGVPLHKVTEGVASSSKNALAALGFKDAAGNLRYPKVDAQDRVLVSSNAGDTACLSARGEVSAGNASDTLICEIDLQPDYQYEQIGFVVSCFRDAQFKVVQVDDATETVLADVLVGAGQYSASEELHCLALTAGSTGTQKLKIVGKNPNALSAMRGTVTVTELQ